jgi:shikimate kinase
VWLIGMMGSGKSTVGPELARRLAWRFLDTDAQVEEDAGCSVAEIFEREGEAAFRERERRALESAAGREAVVALGGGAIAQPGVLEVLSGSGTIVYLRARPDTLLARLGDCGSRPLLRGTAPGERRGLLVGLLAERRAAYQSADVTVDTDDASVAQVVERLMQALNETRGVGART